MSKNLDMLKKDVTKNLLQNKLCSNCKFMNHKQSAEWCAFNKSEPNAGTCHLWQERKYMSAWTESVTSHRYNSST